MLRNRLKTKIASDAYYSIRIHHECEGGIGKSVPRITDWQYEACRVMTNSDPEGRIFLYDFSIRHSYE